MNINELHSFKLSDAIKFHKELNPKIWKNDQLDPLVRKQLLIIAEDFVEELGIPDLDVVDITISGSNAAFTWTKHSDLDLHILVNMSELHQDAVYRELFRAKKTLYNSSHDITVHGIPVELYVQDSAEPVVSLGEYSILHDKWIKIPKRRSANLDQNATKAKFEQLKDLIQVALKTKHSKKISKALTLIRRYRQAGLDKGGEFSPENLAYKAVRSQGAIDALYAMRDKLHSAELTIEEGYAGVKMKFLKPGELRGSFTATKLMALGFKKSQNGSWFIPQAKWEELRKTSQVYEADPLAERLSKEFEDFDPNGKPPGPEFKPTMPAGTVKVDVSDVYDWYKLGQHVSNLKGLGKHDFGKGPPSTILSFGDEETEHKYIKDLEKTGLTTTDIDPLDPKQPKNMPRQSTDPAYNVDSYAEDLDEALDSQPYPYEIEEDSRAWQISTFKTNDDKRYKVWLSKFDGKEVNVEFAYQGDNDIDIDDGVGIQNTGDARRVFATVIEIVKKYASNYKPNTIMFSGDPEEPSRLRLYSALVKRADRMLPDYRNVSGSFMGDRPGEYVLVRKGYQVNEASGYIPSKKEDIEEIGFANALGAPSISDEQIINNSTKDGTIGSRPVFVYTIGPNSIYFFANESTIDALVYLHDGYLKGMKNITPNNKGLIYNLFQYLINLKGQQIKLSPTDTLTPDGIQWILTQIKRKEAGFKIMDQDGNKIDPNTLYDEWESARITGKPGPTAITLGESKISNWLKENEQSLIPMDTYGATLTEVIPHKHSVVEVPDLIEASGYIPSKKEANDPRFKTALTVDVKPDSIQKNAKAFGSKTSRAGIPPQARADGKVK